MCGCLKQSFSSYQDHLDFVKHLINVLMIRLKRFTLIVNGQFLISDDHGTII